IVFQREKTFGYERDNSQRGKKKKNQGKENEDELKKLYHCHVETVKLMLRSSVLLDFIMMCFSPQNTESPELLYPSKHTKSFRHLQSPKLENIFQVASLLSLLVCLH
ncbi:unnamed protein product, partial [Heterotrigona itama]